MATYGYDVYGKSTYGPTAPTGNYPGSQVAVPVVNTAFILPSLGAIALDYGSILVEWGNLPPDTMSTVTEFRLLASPWGFPVDQNDGTVVLDITGTPPTPGMRFIDTTATPGAVQYYGVYILSNGTWLRSGFTACMLPRYHGYDVRLMSDLPPFFQNQDLGTVSQDVPVTDPGIPASGGTVINPYSFGVDIWLSESANVMADGVALGEVTFFPLPANASVTITYGGTLEWQWISRAQQAENTALNDFLSVLGWGLDDVKTQYDMKLRSLNDPMTMSLGDLINFCGQIGLPYNSEIPAYAMRKAALYWGQVMQERGTLGGIAENIALLTGYAADVQTSRNFMLDNDQSAPDTPQYSQWSANVAYQTGEIVQFPTAQEWSIVSTYVTGNVVQYNDLFYTATVGSSGVAPTNTSYWSQNVLGPFDYVCIANTTPGVQPSGSLSANTNWSALYGGNKNGSEYNVPVDIPGLSGAAGTWEYLENNGTQLQFDVGIGFPTPRTWLKGAGTPQTGPNGFGNTFRFANNTAGTLTNTWLRSVCRSSADVTANSLVPDPQLVVEHAVPVPLVTGVWGSSIRYSTNDLVTYGNLNYIALRQSTGATPPSPGVALNQNYDFETGIGPWTAYASAVPSQSSVYAYHGTHSMLVTPNGTQTYPGAISEAIPVIPLANYTLTALVYFPAAYSSGVRLVIQWFDAFGNMGTSAVGSNVIPVAGQWTSLTLSGQAPSNAVTAKILLQYINTPATTDVSYWDLAELTCISTPEWAPLGADSRLPITMSGYGIADLGFTPTVAEAVTPFVEWYDNWGNLISRVFARTSSTSGGYPANYQYDSFDTGAGYPLSGRTLTNPASVWSVPAGTWTVSSNGIAYAGTSDADAIGAVASPAAGTAAITVTNPAQAGDDCGVLFWYQNTSNFWVAGLYNLYYVSSGTTRTPITYANAPATGDRIYAQFNNTASITTLPNSTTVTGPSVIVYKNSLATSNILVVVGSGGTAAQTAMSSLTSPYLPGTSATSSFAGIASIVQ